MKKALLFLIFLLSFHAFAQNNGTVTNRTDASGRKQGVWKKYEEGKLVYEGQFKDNVPYGTFRYYHENGKLKSVSDFQQGVHRVNTTIYHENGHKASEGVFIDQQKDGIWHYYSDKDTLIATEQYDKGKRSGLWRTYSPGSGLLLDERTYSGGKLNGKHTSYYVNGVVNLEENYLNGKRNGLCTAYYPNKHISSSGNYRNGFRDGEWNNYDASGKIRTTMEYRNQRTEATYLYLYIKGHGQKLNQNLIAYFHKAGDKADVVLKSGKHIAIDESFDTVSQWIDFTAFVKVTPDMIVAIDAIAGYTDSKEEDDSDAIIVKIVPTPDEDVRAEGAEAQMVKMLFNTSMPKE